MTFQEILKKYLSDETKESEFLKEMKDNKIFTTNEENLDIRFKKLQDDFNAKDLEHQEATKLIDELKKSNEGNEGIQEKVTEYETRIAELEKENTELRIDSALKLALQNAKVTNVDYIAYKINQDLKANSKSLELDENGHIKGINELIETQKKTDPTFFETEIKKEVNVKDLGKAKEEEGQAEPESLLDALKQKYNPKEEM